MIVNGVNIPSNMLDYGITTGYRWQCMSCDGWSVMYGIGDEMYVECSDCKAKARLPNERTDIPEVLCYGMPKP